MQDKLGGNGGMLDYRDPVLHKPNYLRALDNAVRNKDLPKWKADELRREYDQDMRKEK